MNYIAMALAGAGLLIVFLIITSDIIDFSMYTTRKKRKRQLNFGNSDQEENPAKKILDKITAQIESRFTGIYSDEKEKRIKRDLKLAKWDKLFTPKQYQTLSLVLNGLSIALILFCKVHMYFALVGLFAFYVNAMMLKGTIETRKKKLLNEFPDLIRIVQGYLYADIPLGLAFEEAVQFVSDEWKPIIKQLVIDYKISGLEKALDTMKSEADIFEVREFSSLVLLAFHQGGDVKESFGAQADRIGAIQQLNRELLIEKRRNMAFMIQAPMMLVNIVVFALPVADALMKFKF